MKEPDPGQRETDSEARAPPDFDSLTTPDELVRGARTRDDFFDAVLGLDEPATAGEVADLAGRGVDAAREYLTWFERLGIVTQVSESPATYRRNQEYLNWRRVQRLRDEYANDELIAFLSDEADRAESLRDQFDATSPEDVSITGHASDTGRSVEAVWEDVAAWMTARRRIAILERALTANSSGAADQRTPV